MTLPAIRVAQFVHRLSVLFPKLLRCHANDTEIVIRSQTKSWYFIEECTKTTGHDRFQYTMMLLVIRIARFVHLTWVLSPDLCRYYSRNVECHPARR